IINGILHGIEIKSDADSLSRINRQVEYYGKVMDKVTLYVGNKLYPQVLDYIPGWWGVVLVTKPVGSDIQLKQIRKERMNKYQDAFEILQLLWKDEALKAIDQLKISGKFSNKSRDIIFEAIERSTSLKTVRDLTRETL